ncbi:MAG TPA: class I SAM-dependent methyltransferase [Ktedonobacterales bacterium]
MDVKETVRQQFDPVAGEYAVSVIHASGPDLTAMVGALPLRGDERVLDAGSGAGHSALAFAPYVAQVVALDLADAMLAQGRRLATERGIANVTFRRGDIEALDEPDGSFDVVTSRYSAHHYPHPRRALAEIARVLKPGGVFLLVDLIASADPAPDTVLNAIELLRDPSHVRDHTREQWLGMLHAAKLVGEVAGTWPLHMQFDSWVARMRTPLDQVMAIRKAIDQAPREVREAVAIEPDYSFTVEVALIIGRKPV